MPIRGRTTLLALRLYSKSQQPIELLFLCLADARISFHGLKIPDGYSSLTRQNVTFGA
jgi:hypothetical protein